MLCGAYELVKKSDGFVDVSKFLALDKASMGEILNHLKQIDRMDVYVSLRAEVVQRNSEEQAKIRRLEDSVNEDLVEIQKIDTKLAQLNREKCEVKSNVNKQSEKLVGGNVSAASSKTKCAIM